MTVLVVGATGATGRQLVQQLVDRGRRVKVIVRSPDRLPPKIRSHPLVSIVHAGILDVTEADLRQHVADCTAIASCLGHTMDLRGIYGAPRRLVTEAVRRLCKAIEAGGPRHGVRFVLMNTAGNRGPGEPASFGERFATGLVRLLVPPHADNEQAAAFLRHQRKVEWVVVRPDTLVDGEPSAYEVHPKPTRSAIFDAGQTSRSNVARFMAELIVEDAAWDRWKGRMPVVYDQGFA